MGSELPEQIVWGAMAGTQLGAMLSFKRTEPEQELTRRVQAKRLHV